jgi:WS/DGAT/MGAT family acyltransferase
MSSIVAGQAWGASRVMSDVEAVFWRAETDPRLRSGGVVLDLLDCAPDWLRLVEAHRWAVQCVPRLGERVIDDVLRIGPPVWSATEVDFGYHLTRVRLGGGGMAELLEVAGWLHMEAFDASRPLWRAMLVEGLPDGAAAYLLKVHHSMADGSGTIQLFDLLHASGRERTKRDLPAWPAAPSVSPSEVASARLHGLAAAAPGALAKLAQRAGGVVRNPERAAAYAASLARVSSGRHGTPSPLMASRGLARRLRVLDVPVAELRAAGKALGGTLNDAFLAGLVGGLGRYHAAHGVAVSDLPIALPVSLRTETDAPGGNRFAAATIAAPAGEPSPRRRLELLRERVAAARAEPALDMMTAVAPLASRLPAPALAWLAMRMSSVIDLQASNIRGLAREAYLAGARITQMYIFGPVPGSAVMTTLVSHQQTCCIAIATDHDAVPDPDLLQSCFAAGLAEVLAEART